jgi:spore maturation protein CgeB
MAQRDRCTHLLATGLAPLCATELAAIRATGVRTINFMTDDPWNPAHHAAWFMAGLRSYDFVFSPRRQNLPDFRAFGCGSTAYLPFAYCPEVHFPARRIHDAGDADLLFAGAADTDRVHELRALLQAGLRLALYGAYWERYADLRSYTNGIADLATLRQATSSAKLVLCLVRRANRDGHAMRSFEAPAMGGCLLMEDTEEHRELFGAEGECVVYFRDADEMVAKAKALLPRAEERARLAAAAHQRICSGGHTYADRLRTMLAE